MMFTDEIELNKQTTDSRSAPLRRFAVKLLTGVATACVVAALQGLIRGSWSPWIHKLSLLVIAAIAIYLTASATRAMLPRWQRARSARKLNSQMKMPLLACASMFSESMNQSFVKSLGSVLNSLVQTQALDARVCNLYHGYLNTLATAARHLIGDVKAERLDAVEGLERLSVLHRDYVRLNCEIASNFRVSSRPDIHRCWDEIRDHTNMISGRLTDLTTQLREANQQHLSHPYFQNVPRVSFE